MTCPTAGFWGYHLMIDASGLECEEYDLNNTQYLLEFVREILVKTDMRAWGEPMVQHLTEADGEFPDSLSGYTIVQLLHTSNMTLHVCDKVKTLYFDLFSCKQFDNDSVKESIVKYFKPASCRINFVTRHA